MLTFLRHIRKGLLGDGQAKESSSPAGRYLLYALGEIALVVIGILIALQINNWNEGRIQIEKERLILDGLQNVFKENLATLVDRDYPEIYAAYDASIEFLEIIGPNASEVSNKNVDSLLFCLVSIGSYYPSTGVIDELLYSGQLSLIRNVKLRNHLSNWPGIFEDYREDIGFTFDYLQREVLPLLSKYISWRNTDRYLKEIDFRHMKLSILSESQFSNSYVDLKNSKEIENVIYLNSVNLAYMINEYSIIRSYFEESLDMIDASISK